MVAVSCEICSQTTDEILLIAFKYPELFKGSRQHFSYRLQWLSIWYVNFCNAPDIIQKHEDKCIGARLTSEHEMRPYMRVHSAIFMFKSTPPLYISVCTFLILGQLALCSVFQLYPVQENVLYLYQLRSRRSEQQRAEDNASPGINNLQGNWTGPAGSCIKILKMEEVPHVKNRKCGPLESASLHTAPISAILLPVRGFHSNLPPSCA